MLRYGTHINSPECTPVIYAKRILNINWFIKLLNKTRDSASKSDVYNFDAPIVYYTRRDQLDKQIVHPQSKCENVRISKIYSWVVSFSCCNSVIVA